MDTELAKANEEFTDIVNRRAKAQKIRRQANERVDELEIEAAEQEKEIEQLKAKGDELINECAINPKIEKQLDTNDKEIKRATELLDRKKKMIAAARKAAETEVPSIDEGQKLLEKLGVATAKHIVHTRQKDLDIAKSILVEAYACYSFITWRTDDTWQDFLVTVFDFPAEESLTEASEKFNTEIVSPIEEAAEKGV